MRAIGASITALNLEFLIADILEEQRNPVFITFKRTYVYRVNRTSRDSICQSKGFKRIESFRLSNRCRRLDRGSNYNMLFEDDDDEVFKNAEIEFESDLDPEIKVFYLCYKELRPR